ncbi:MAG: purine-nucleoside phosphorylase [Vulcanimicrobiaceae bacterium]
MKKLKKRAGGEIDFAIVLGTGLSGLVSELIHNAKKVPYAELGLPRASLVGHAGEAIIGEWHNRRVAAFSGRYHLYQGFDARQVTAQVDLAHGAGAKTIILTNACGGLNPNFNATDLMLITDQINLTGTSPIIGPDDPNPFIEMLGAYDPELADLARKRAAALGINLREGVYAGLVGPAFETLAEARWLRSIADVVGMSTVLETIRARYLKMRVLGFSVITNMVGLPTSHEEVIAAGNARAGDLARLLDSIVESL